MQLGQQIEHQEATLEVLSLSDHPSGILPYWGDVVT